jgi:hypothetical protein
MSDIRQQFTVAPRDDSTSFEQAEAIIRDVLAKMPDAQLVDTDTKNRIAVVEVPTHAAAAVREALEQHLLVDPNGTLRI